LNNLWICDFRGAQLQYWSETSEQADTPGNTFITDDNAEHTWLATVADAAISSKVETGMNVIILLGFNDCINSCTWKKVSLSEITKSYCTTINQLIKQFSSVNFYFCSVNPINKDYPSASFDGHLLATNVINTKIKTFNEQIKLGCNATYIDTHSYLTSTGFTTRDGARYTSNTCADIYSYISGHLKSTFAPAFTMRTEAPTFNTTSDGDGDSIVEGDYWLSTSNGGLNPFPITSAYSKRTGDTLPNCTAYAWGRFYEITGEKPKLSLNNAEKWYSYNDGYERGSTPALGAVLCWEGVGDAAGHVAIVEQINEDGSIVTSESGWETSSYWWTTTRKNDGNWDANTSKYKFQGFIYCPMVKQGTIIGIASKNDVTSSNASLGTNILKEDFSNVNQISEEMKKNAAYIWQYLGNKGWTLNAVAGLLGNMQAESTINPGRWQSGRVEGPADGHGYGLVQWTPYTKYTEWCASNGYDIKDIDAALTRIIWEVDNNKQWITKASYPISFKDFTTSKKEAAWLAGAFVINYERPADQSEKTQRARGRNATYWYNFLSGYSPEVSAPLAIKSLKVCDIFPTGIKGSCILINSTSGNFTLLDQKDVELGKGTLIFSSSESMLKVATFNQADLLPNTTYKIKIEVVGESENDKITDILEFTTPQDFPRSVTSISLSATDTKLPSSNFLLTAKPSSYWGYWKKYGYGYNVLLIINGEIVSQKSVKTLQKSWNFSLKDIFSKYNLATGDSLQIGIQPWVIDNKGNKIYVESGFKASESICMLGSHIRTYLKAE
jgi:surface antigen